MTEHSEGTSLYEEEIFSEQGRHSMAAAKVAAQVMNLLEIAKASAGITQADLAQSLDITEGRVSQVLNGDGNFHIATIARFLSAMGATMTITAADKHGQLLRRNRRRQPNRAPRLSHTPLDVHWVTTEGVKTTRAAVQHDSRMNLLAVSVLPSWKNSSGASEYQQSVNEAVAVEMRAETSDA